MNDLNGQSQLSKSVWTGYWQRLPLFVRAIISGLFVFAVAGTLASSAIFGLVPMPWSLIAIMGMLWIYLKYFSGSWWPESTASVRAEYFRDTRLSTGVLRWSLTASALMVISFQSLLVVTFRIIEFPAEAFALGVDLDSFPVWQVLLFLITAAALAGVTEEVGFRGYMQVPLENRYGPVAAIAIVVAMFVLVHFSLTRAPVTYFQMIFGGVQLGVLAYVSGSLIPPIIAHTAADIITFLYWKTDVAGTFAYQPIAQTGIDAHSVLWAFIFVVSVVLFIAASRRAYSVRRQMSGG